MGSGRDDFLSFGNAGGDVLIVAVRAAGNNVMFFGFVMLSTQEEKNMKYINAEEILPKELLNQIKHYAAGKLLYIPTDNKKKA